MSEPRDPDRLSRSEIGKDAVQSGAEAAANAVGEVATIITGAVRDVATALGGLATELFEIGDAARRAAEDRDALAADRDAEVAGGADTQIETTDNDAPEGPPIS